jgi:tetratricopeptide (TPR) repeat protein
MLQAISLATALALLPQGAGLPTPDDPALRAVVERFFATQEAEDVDGYLSLWSAKAERPRREQLQYIFESGDDKFRDLTMQRVGGTGDSVRVRVSVMRSRTNHLMKGPDGASRTFNLRYVTSLTFVREGADWKLLREGVPADDLAIAVLAAPTERERNALLDAEPDLLDERVLEAMSRRGDAEAQKGRNAEAQQIYERILEVARRLGNRKSEGRALQNVANALYFQRQFARAIETYEQRLALERAQSNDEGIAAALSGIGTVRYAQFEYSAALASHREALAIQERLDDTMALASTLISTGNVLYVQGDYEAAIVDYVRARDQYRRLAYTGGEARALEGLGLAYAAHGDFASALEAYGKVLDEWRARKAVHGQAGALFSIAEIHFRLGNIEVARPLFDQSRTLFESVKDLARAGRGWQGIALTDLVAARFAGAEQAYVKSQQACAAVADDECVAHAVVGAAFAQASQDRFDEAIATYGKGILLFSNLDKVEEAARGEIGLSRALAGKADYDGALRAARRAQERAQAIKSDDVMWRALVSEARAHQGLGDSGSAMQAVRGAMTTLERMNRTALERPGYRIASDSVAVFGLLAILQADAGDAAGALDTAEQLRSHALRLSIAANEREIYRAMSAEEREDERRLTIELASLYVQRDKERGLPKPDAERIKRLDVRIREAAEKRAAQQQRLFERHPDLRTWRGLTPPPGHREIPLGRGDVMLQFVIDDNALLVLTAAAGEETPEYAAHAVPIPRQKFAERIARIMEPAALRDLGEWRRRMTELTSLLPASVLSLLRSAARVIVVPDDILWRIPFEALPLEDLFLGDRATVTYAASAFSLHARSALDQTAKEAPPPEGAPSGIPMLAAGAPVLADEMRERVKATAPGWALRAAASAEREMTRAASVYDGAGAVVKTGVAATEAAFRAEAARAAVLHLAVPFRMNSASPLFSPLLFSPPPSPTTADRTDDGVLDAREVMNMSLEGRAVILSDAAATSMRNAADAMPAVQWAWLASGVPTLVLPRWASDDAVNHELLADVHKRLKAGGRAGEALRRAAAAIRGRPETRAPYFWAQWMAIGRDR